MRAGLGVDAHRFGGPGPLRLAGVIVEASRGLVGTSDADVVAHAVADALLGAAALGDLGSHFPSDDPGLEGADSMGLLAQVAGMVREAGFEIESIDATVIAEEVRVAPHRDRMREALAAALGMAVARISVKATSTDGMGLTGTGEGIAATAIALVS